LFFQDSSFSRLLEPNQDKNEFKIVLVLFILGMSVGCGVGSKLWEMLMRKTKIISRP
jgi:dolichyl-phosphate-mannose--protein O-mannosyl transferase